jgi:hypothetical protein
MCRIVSQSWLLFWDKVLAATVFAWWLLVSLLSTSTLTRTFQRWAMQREPVRSQTPLRSTSTLDWSKSSSKKTKLLGCRLNWKERTTLSSLLRKADVFANLNLRRRKATSQIKGSFLASTRPKLQTKNSDFLTVSFQPCSRSYVILMGLPSTTKTASSTPSLLSRKSCSRTCSCEMISLFYRKSTKL